MTNKEPIENTSGIYPVLDKILIKVDEIKKEGLLDLSHLNDKRMDAQVAGVLVAVGPDAYIHYIQETPDGTVVSKYTQPAALVGQRIMFAKYGGLDVLGKDGHTYRVMRDEDITALLDDDVAFVDIELRTPMQKKKK